MNRFLKDKIFYFFSNHQFDDNDRIKITYIYFQMQLNNICLFKILVILFVII